ncbi:autoinducer binding domain-containing protein [Phenylobacterium sp.]|uniref:helix-turn-helix transcriptional regulator n=1 Tax=Phenylobacterium sp. TaxID=1871053 RepID=UPI0035AE0CD5
MTERYAEALKFLRESRSIGDVVALEGHFAGLVSRFGFERTSFVIMAEPGRPIQPKVLFGLGDASRRQDYLSRGRYRYDPVFRAVFTHTRAFTWTDIEPMVVGEEAKDLFATARRDGSEGLIVPIHGALGEVSALTLVGRGVDISEQARAVLQACGAMFATAGLQLLELEGDRATPTGLTRRETQVLVWLSRGKSIPEICQILGVSIGTAKTHLERAKAKLGYLSTVPAILEAARRGWLIDPEDFDH